MPITHYYSTPPPPGFLEPPTALRVAAGHPKHSSFCIIYDKTPHYSHTNLWTC